MKLTAVFVSFFAALILSATARAETPWAFAGIQMGEPLSASQLPSCPMPDAYSTTRWTPPTKICVMDMGDKNADGTQNVMLGGLQELKWPELYASSATLWNDRVLSLQINVHHAAFDTVRQILTARYGKPIKTARDKVTSNAGADLDSLTITWRESGNTISLEERCMRIDRSCVEVFNDAYMKKRLAAQKQATESAASIL